MSTDQPVFRVRGLCKTYRTGEVEVQALTRQSGAVLTRYRRDHVGSIFQFYNLVPSLTARENVKLVTEIARNPMQPEEALALVGLSARMDHFPAQLSGGEQQCGAIARAFGEDEATPGDGFRVVARITVWEGKQLVAVPIAALFRQGGGWAVYVVANGRAELRLVELGRRNAAFASVNKGLAADGVAVVSGLAD